MPNKIIHKPLLINFMPSGYVYILANKPYGTLYVGVTSDLVGRIWQHKNKIYQGFTRKYDVNKLVYFEEFEDIYDAIIREKQIKKFYRCYKIKLIEDFNPSWIDYFEQWYSGKITIDG